MAGFRISEEERERLKEIELAKRGRIVITETTLEDFIQTAKSIFGEDTVYIFLYHAGKGRGRRIVQHLLEENPALLDPWELLQKAVEILQIDGMIERYLIKEEKGNYCIQLYNTIETRVRSLEYKNNCSITKSFMDGIAEGVFGKKAKVKEIEHCREEGEDFYCTFKIQP